MKTPLLRLLALFALTAVALRAADSKIIAAVRAADDERVKATQSGDRARLDAIYSDDLHYAHSSAKVDTKASYLDSLVSRRTVYSRYDYQQRDFRPVAPGIVLMTGRVTITVGTMGQPPMELSYLAVWREEKGKWRFLAWQSCKVPDPAAKK